MKLPSFNINTFPFLLVSDETHVYLYNIKEESQQTFIQANIVSKGGFVKVGKKAFEFHFVSSEKLNDKEGIMSHHYYSFRDDLISVMEINGQMPNANLQENL